MLFTTLFLAKQNRIANPRPGNHLVPGPSTMTNREYCIGKGKERGRRG